MFYFSLQGRLNQLEKRKLIIDNDIQEEIMKIENLQKICIHIRQLEAPDAISQIRRQLDEMRQSDTQNE